MTPEAEAAKKAVSPLTVMCPVCHARPHYACVGIDDGPVSFTHLPRLAASRLPTAIPDCPMCETHCPGGTHTAELAKAGIKTREQYRAMKSALPVKCYICGAVEGHIAPVQSVPKAEIPEDEVFLERARVFMSNSENLGYAPLVYMIAAAFKNEAKVAALEQHIKELEKVQ